MGQVISAVKRKDIGARVNNFTGKMAFFPSQAE
jgi:hypothetical protein